jgi:MFS family permease
MQATNGLSITDGAWLASANYAGYLAGALVATWRPTSARAAIRTGLLAIGVTTFFMGLDLGVIGWMALRALAGLASAYVFISASAWCIQQLGARDRAALSGAAFAGVGAGIALAGLLTLATTARGGGPSDAWVVLGLVAIVICLSLRGVLDEEGTNPSRSVLADARVRWGADAVLLVACYGVFGFAYVIPATFVPALAREVVPDPLIFGWSWPLFGMAAAISTLFASALVARYGARVVWAASSLLMALGLTALALSTTLATIVMTALCVGGSFMVTTMSALQEARSVGGAGALRLISAMTAAFAFGQMVGPLVAGRLVEATGTFAVVLLVASALLALSSAGLLWLMPQRGLMKAWKGDTS